MSAAAKRALRSQLRGLRRALPTKIRAAESAACAATAIALISRMKPPTVASYAALDDEVDLDAMHGWCWQHGLPVLLPRVSGPGVLSWHRITGPAELAPGAHGIREPLASLPACAVSPLTLLFVPGIGFTADGHRLGQGGGYYDRLLAASRRIAVGVAFDCQLMDHLPCDPHDQLLAGLIVAGRLLRDPTAN